MTEFSTEASLLVTPDQQSLRDARSEIEDALGDVSVGVSTSGASSRATGGSRIAGRERAMSRQLLTDQNTRLGTVTEHLDRGLELDEARNDLLRDLIEETESGNFSRAKSGGGLGGLGGLLGATAGLLGGVGLAGVIASRVGDALGNINPTEAIGSVDLIPDDVVASPASVAAADLIGTPATLTAADVIAGGVTLVAADVIGTPAALAAMDVIDTPADIVSADVIGTAATLIATDVVGQAATVVAADVISDPVSLSPSDIVDIPEGGINVKKLLAGALTAGAGAEAARRASQGSGPFGTTGVGSAVTAPFAIPSMLIGQSERRRDRGEEGLLERFLPDLPNLGGGQGQRRRAAVGVTPTASSSDSISAANPARERYDRRGNGTDATVTYTIEGRSDAELKRLIDRRAKQHVEELRRDLTGP